MGTTRWPRSESSSLTVHPNSGKQRRIDPRSRTAPSVLRKGNDKSKGILPGSTAGLSTHARHPMPAGMCAIRLDDCCPPTPRNRKLSREKRTGTSCGMSRAI
eukprot:1716559-Alexandrium_andersonii.AAC.1